MSVITIARQFGSGGKDIARQIADRLGYECVDKELIADVAQTAGVSEEVVEQVDEKGETTIRRFLNELFTPSNIYSLSPEYPPLIWPYVPSSDLPNERADPYRNTFLDENEYLKILQETIQSLAKRDNIVIVGRGSQCILKDHPNTLHIRFIAPLEYRIQLMMQELKLERQDAENLIHEKDKQRTLYLQNHYDENWDNPELYHFILNTDKFSWTHMTDLIVQATGMLK